MLSYTIVTASAGPNDAVAATLADAFPAELSGVSWTCVGTDRGSCTPSGTGDITDTVDLPDYASG
jgi:uncharacterized repeat protein (TIGR01451 family)